MGPPLSGVFEAGRFTAGRGGVLVVRGVGDGFATVVFADDGVGCG